MIEAYSKKCSFEIKISITLNNTSGAAIISLCLTYFYLQSTAGNQTTVYLTWTYCRSEYQLQPQIQPTYIGTLHIQVN